MSRVKSSHLFGAFVAVLLMASAFAVPGPANAAVIFTNTHNYAYGGDDNAVTILVEVFDNYMGDFNKYLWQYTVTNNSYEPNPGTSNGFSGFETALPAAVPDLGDVFGPNADWEFDCCSGQPVEWDIRNSDGPGVLVGETGVFGFTSLPRLVTESTGYFHTWQNDGQTDIVSYEPGNGVEVPDVLSAPIGVPAPASLGLVGLALAGLGFAARRRRVA